MRGLEGMGVAVTGGGSGIGRAAAKRLAEEGCVVAILDLNRQTGEETAALCGKGARPYQVDITQYDQVRRAAEQFEAEGTPVTGLVNVAGYDSPNWFLDTDQAHWDKHLAVNLYGALVTSHVFVRGMVERRRGRVVNVASGSGLVGTGVAAVYSAAKGGLIAFTKALAREVAKHGVILNTVAPGPTDTPMFRGHLATTPVAGVTAEGIARAIPMGRLAQPEDYAGTIAYLLSDDAGFMTGQTISISGGLTMT